MNYEEVLKKEYKQKSFCICLPVKNRIENGEKVIDTYICKIVLDTDDYKYRIFNETSNSLWANCKFETFEEAKEYLINKEKEFKTDKEEV